MIEQIPNDEETEDESNLKESFQLVNNLSQEETLLFTLKIKDSLCLSPYACASILYKFEKQEFVGYAENKYNEDKTESINERILSL